MNQHRRTVFVLPSTRRFLALAVRLQCNQKRTATVIGSRLSSGSSPGAALSQRKDAALVLCFTDQLVGNAEANVSVQSAAGTHFISPAEAILIGQRGYRGIVWCKDGWLRVSPGSDARQISRILSQHLMDCAALGDAWLARDLQALRHARHRIEAAYRSVRLFRSALLDAGSEEPAGKVVLSTLSRLARFENALKEWERCGTP